MPAGSDVVSIVLLIALSIAASTLAFLLLRRPLNRASACAATATFCLSCALAVGEIVPQGVVQTTTTIFFVALAMWFFGLEFRTDRAAAATSPPPPPADTRSSRS